MTYDIAIATEPGRHLAVTRFETTTAELAERIGPAFGRVVDHLGRHGVEPAGPAIAHYTMGTDSFSVAAGFVVAAPIATEDSVESMQLPEGDVLTTLHVGSYTDLPKAYEALQAQARELGRELDPRSMWEEYLTGPDVPQSEQQTLISWPLTS